MLSKTRETTRAMQGQQLNDQKKMLYCEAKNDKDYSKKDWKSMSHTLGIKPLGLSNIEIEILSILKERGNCSLQMLSAVTGMSRTAIQKEAEL